VTTSPTQIYRYVFCVWVIFSFLFCFPWNDQITEFRGFSLNFFSTAKILEIAVGHGFSGPDLEGHLTDLYKVWVAQYLSKAVICYASRAWPGKPIAKKHLISPAPVLYIHLFWPFWKMGYWEKWLTMFFLILLPDWPSSEIFMVCKPSSTQYWRCLFSLRHSACPVPHPNVLLLPRPVAPLFAQQCDLVALWVQTEAPFCSVVVRPPFATTVCSSLVPQEHISPVCSSETGSQSAASFH